MGGRLISNSVRLNRLDHDDLRSKIMGDLRLFFKNCPVGLTEALRDKKDFGDIDIVVGVEALGEWPVDAIRDFLKERYDVKDSHLNAKTGYENDDPLKGRTILKQNRGVLSFGMPHPQGMVQVDLILTPKTYFNITCQYFNWGGIGNLVGRCASQMGLGLGIEGLQYSIRPPGVQGKTFILVTADYSKALTYLGYDPKRFNQGFNNQQEVFDYTVTSPWFDGALYLPENRSHDRRVRDDRHPLHVDFLKWLEDSGQINHPSPIWPERNFFIEKAKQDFPDFAKRLEEFDEKYKALKEQAVPFTGDDIKSWFGLSEGKEVGMVLKPLQKAWAEDKSFRNDWNLAIGVEEQKSILRQKTGLSKSSLKL